MSQEYEQQKIMQVDLEREMKKSYIDYAMSVIVGRALPDVRDGLKPVHRRILYAMYEDGLTSDKPYRKSATTVGNVLGRYHPHGDASVYDAMVRMAQPFSLHYPLIDGHGNFGSVDGDPPAAYRYTEARMAKLANYMLADIKKNTVDFQPNFDEERQEPVVLPSRFPQPAGERLVRYRGRHGNQHPAAQPRGGHRRHLLCHRPSRGGDGRDLPVHQGTGLPDRRRDHGPQRHPRRLCNRPRQDQGSRKD